MPCRSSRSTPLPDCPAGLPDVMHARASRSQDLMSLLRGGASIVFPYGTQIEPVPVAAAASESVFLQGMDWADHGISKSMLGPTLAVDEGENMSRAAAETHSDVMELGFHYPKTIVQNMLKKALRTLVSFNFGEEAARDCTPDYVLTAINKSDWAMWSGIAISAFQSGYLTYEQKVWLDEKLGLPKSTISPEEEQIPGNMPAVAVFQKIMTQIQGAEQQRQAEQQAQMQQQQGMVPQGMASPNHPSNQQQQPTGGQAA